MEADSWPSMRIEPQNASSFYLLADLLRPYWKQSLAAVSLAVLGAVIEGLGLAGIVSLLDVGGAIGGALGKLLPLDWIKLSEFSSEQRAITAATLLGIVGLGRAFAFFMASCMMMWLAAETERAQRLRLIDRLLAVDFQSLGKTSTGTIQDSLTTHVTWAGQSVQLFLQLSGQILIVSCYVFLLALLSPAFTLVSVLFFGIVGSLLQKFLIPKITQTVTSENETRGRALDRACDLLQGHEVVRDYGREEWFREKIAGEINLVSSYSKHSGFLRSVPMPTAQLSAAFLASLILITGAFLYPPDNMTWLADATLFIVVLLRLLIPVSSIMTLWGHFVVRMPSVSELRKIQMVFEIPSTLSHGVSSENQNAIAAIQRDDFQGLECVSISMSFDEHHVLRDLSFSIFPGQLIAITGPSGCGKTTLTRVITGTIMPSSGRLYSGGDVIDSSSPQWRRQFSVVSQAPFLFQGTIQENLMMIRTDASHEFVESCLRRAHCEFVFALPDGLQTEIGSIQKNLSGGQIQRLAIARALMAERPVLVLDEPTSGLDSAAEDLMTQTIESLVPELTVIVIAHRLNTIANADQQIELPIHEPNV